MKRVNICRACVNLRNGVKTRLPVQHTCGRSYEEIAQEEEEGKRNAKRFRSMLDALDVIKEVKENQGKIICPECGGDLHFRISLNGHVWGKCKTEGCLSWVQ